ncbi:hypothetical protein, partial [Pseudomonas syringae group genomosp. 3]|uniref:hypothetical protein n=1 Tax=Pseudomonas syringae group genomosp. 3 TaxID=251701 RepID=UPI001F2653DB
RIMASWLLRESGSQLPGSAKHFECGVYGALTDFSLPNSIKASIHNTHLLRGEHFLYAFAAAKTVTRVEGLPLSSPNSSSS